MLCAAYYAYCQAYRLPKVVIEFRSAPGGGSKPHEVSNSPSAPKTGLARN
jgi:hypothetical protein